MDQRRKLLKIHIHLRGLDQQVRTSNGRNKSRADIFWGWLLIMAGCSSGPRGWLSGCSHIQPVALDFKGKVMLQRLAASTLVSRRQLFPAAVYFSDFHKPNPRWWLGQAGDSSHHKHDLCWSKCPVFPKWRSRWVIWLGPESSHHTSLSSCLMHFRGGNSMDHFLVDIVVKYIKARMIDWF